MPSCIYRTTAEGIADITRNPIKVKRLRKQAEHLENSCLAAVDAGKVENIAEVWQNMLAYYAQNLPKREITQYGALVERTEAEALELWIIAMQKFLAATEADKLDAIRLEVSWRKSAMWGWNPTCTAYTAAEKVHRHSTPVESCGYCKLSTAIGGALRQSAAVRRLLIESWPLVKNCYGVDAHNGLPQIDIDGKGVAELEKLLSCAGWTRCSYEQRAHVKGDFVGAIYSKH